MRGAAHRSANLRTHSELHLGSCNSPVTAGARLLFGEHVDHRLTMCSLGLLGERRHWTEVVEPFARSNQG
jgi:hypothetical protein